MEFGILGPLAARRDGVDLPLGGPKPRVLLVLLLLHANEVVSRDALIEGLWGERAPATAPHTLDNYISRLRGTLDRDRIQTRPPGYLIRVEPGELDLDRFQELALRGQSQLAAGSFAEASATLREALAVWRGAALADLVYEAWLGLEAERLDELRLPVIEDRMDAELALGRGPELVTELQSLSGRHPLRERLVGQLMQALYRAGRQPAALDVYRAARHRLADELGLEPSPQLQELQGRILGHDPSLRAEVATGNATPGPVSSRRLSRRRATLVFLVLLAISVAAAALAVLTTRGKPERAVSDTNQLVLLRPRDGSIVSTLAQTSTPAALAAAGQSIWVAVPDENAVIRVDPSGQRTDRVPLPVQPGEVVVGGGAVWVSSTAGDTITRIDPSTDAITKTIHLGATPGGMCFCLGALWIVDPDDRAVLRLDPTTFGTRSIAVPGSPPTAIAAGRRAIWIASYEAGTVTELEPRTGSPLNVIHVGQGPSSLAFGSGSLWVANTLDGTVSAIDATSGTVVRTIPTGSSPSAVTFSGGALWVANEFSATVSRITPRTGTVTNSIPVGGAAVSIASSRAGVWVGTRASRDRRGGTLVLLDSRRFQSIDPQVDYETTPPGFLGLVNDTLVAFDHTTGDDGFQLVPDLALRLPQVSADGETYLFELRPDLRYSNGRLVQASDFVRSMTRLFRVSSPGVSFFSVVVGGSACVRQHLRCELTHGVVADDAARTVTFHLAAPDPDFLFKLALGFVVPIPPGTPMHEVRTDPVLGTGPYVFAHVGAKQFIFTRNSRFREWSHAAQPEGNPDRIVWRFGLTPDQEIRAVAKGRADWTGDFPADLAPVLRRHAAEVHSNMFPGGYFVQIDTQRKPFSDVRVRRALNYAIDRSAIVALTGGRALSAPLCQTIPPGLPGYRPYCPYTKLPSSDGRWTAPDFARATALVAASRTAGERVSVWSVSDTGTAEPAATYLSALLTRLGFRSRVRVRSTPQMARLTPKAVSRMQLHLVIFGPDYPSPAETYALFLACNGEFTHQQFCDPALDHEADRAEALRVSNPGRSNVLWAKIDRKLVNDAVWIPLTTQRILDFVSTRLRNYQFSPVYHFLPAQASLK